MRVAGGETLAHAADPAGSGSGDYLLLSWGARVDRLLRGAMDTSFVPTTPAAPGSEDRGRELLLVPRGLGPLDAESAAFLVDGADAWRFVPLPSVLFGLIAALGTILATGDLIAGSVIFLIALGVVPLVMAVGSHAAFHRRAVELGLPEERACRLLQAYKRASERIVPIDDERRGEKLRDALLEADRAAWAEATTTRS